MGGMSSEVGLRCNHVSLVPFVSFLLFLKLCISTAALTQWGTRRMCLRRGSCS